LSTVSVRGLTVCGCASALRKNRFAAAVSRRAAELSPILGDGLMDQAAAIWD
jgi:hypothetical protein